MNEHKQQALLPDSGVHMMELYAGIGGMRAAATEIGLNLEAVYPYEINPSALEAYSHNFTEDGTGAVDNCSARKRIKSSCGTKKKFTAARNLLGLSVAEVTKLSPHLLTMSPPCQPFTRQGLQQDTADRRCDSLQHVLTVLKELPNPPARILLENVKGFETSHARDQLLQVLDCRGYTYQEFLLCPTQLGVPNSRLRYYLLAVREGKSSRASPASNCSSTAAPEASNAAASMQDPVSREFPLCLCISPPQHDISHGEEEGVSNQTQLCDNILQPPRSGQQDSINCGQETHKNSDQQGGKSSELEERKNSIPKVVIKIRNRGSRGNCSWCGKVVIPKASELLRKFHSLCQINNEIQPVNSCALNTNEKIDAICHSKLRQIINSDNGSDGTEACESWGNVEEKFSGTVVNCTKPLVFSDLTPTLGDFLHKTRENICSQSVNQCDYLKALALRSNCYHSSTRSCRPEGTSMETIVGNLPSSEASDDSNMCLIPPPTQNFMVKNELNNHCHANKNDGIEFVNVCYHFTNYLLKEKLLTKYAWLLDIVDASSRRSCCFTKGYSRLVEGTGSVFNPSGRKAMDEAYLRLTDLRKLQGTKENTSSVSNFALSDAAVIERITPPGFIHSNLNSREESVQNSAMRTSEQKNPILKNQEVCENFSQTEEVNAISAPSPASLGLRYFSPEEALRLMAFPAYFHFPTSLSTRQQYRLVGNSVNVLVIAVLLATLFQMQ
uniref:tRNA (cytosine(38)-C(5))-methyltransferase n=1 Tax=Hirondellea gigas TaxID=1518452 RepID=A0A2P2HXY1_9CRUS